MLLPARPAAIVWLAILALLAMPLRVVAEEEAEEPDDSERAAWQARVASGEKGLGKGKGECVPKDRAREGVSGGDGTWANRDSGRRAAGLPIRMPAQVLEADPLAALSGGVRSLEEAEQADEQADGQGEQTWVRPPGVSPNPNDIEWCEEEGMSTVVLAVIAASVFVVLFYMRCNGQADFTRARGS
eukprot:TRINITY_DN8195_c0_g1_i4.p1 TRINITY_DN8195_c0_g1~~TRINITY_DN8195_c0_g1_i4.p1  ORF type:complete len:186 (+),score=23.13 TRINITY_DN8195_c0_g1_i4:120-677(+)